MLNWKTDLDASAFSFVTVSEVKTYLGIDASAEFDTFLQDAIYSVGGAIQRLTGQNMHDASAVVTATYGPHSQMYELPLLPVDSITSIKYYSVDDSSGTLTAQNDYKEQGQTGNRYGAYYVDIWNKYNEVEIVYNSTPATIPYELKMAGLAWLRSIYNDDRDFTGEFETRPPDKTMQLLTPFVSVYI